MEEFLNFAEENNCIEEENNCVEEVTDEALVAQVLENVNDEEQTESFSGNCETTEIKENYMSKNSVFILSQMRYSTVVNTLIEDRLRPRFFKENLDNAFTTVHKN